MKLVVSYHVGDGYTYSCDVTTPLEYESAEAFIVHFEDKLKEYLTKCDEEYTPSEFTLAGIEFSATDHIWNQRQEKRKSDKVEYVRHIDLPTVETLEEWFENNKPKEAASLSTR